MGCFSALQAQHLVPADGRYNFNVRYDIRGLDFIMRLKPLTYQFDVRKFERRTYHSDAAYTVFNYNDEKLMRTRRSGFIAQDVEDAALASGFQFSGISKPSDKKDHYALSYEAFVVPVVKSIQEQQELITDQQHTIDQQKKRLESLEKDIRTLSEKLNTLLSLLEKDIPENSR